MNNNYRNARNRRPFIDMYRNSKLSFKSKKFWMAIILPPMLIIIIVAILSLIANDYSLFNNCQMLKFFFAGCFAMYIILVILDMTQMIIRDFLEEDAKGRIWLGAIIVIMVFIKVLWKLPRK